MLDWIGSTDSQFKSVAEADDDSAIVDAIDINEKSLMNERIRASQIGLILSLRKSAIRKPTVSDKLAFPSLVGSQLLLNDNYWHHQFQFYLGFEFT